jgi:hypothetical protein
MKGIKPGGDANAIVEMNALFHQPVLFTGKQNHADVKTKRINRVFFL